MHSLRDRAKSTAAMKSERPAILVVDDNEDNRYTLQTLLEADGFERIASAAGGNEAIKSDRERKIQSRFAGHDDAGSERRRSVAADPE